jgi:hypothetical protein
LLAAALTMGWGNVGVSRQAGRATVVAEGIYMVIEAY